MSLVTPARGVTGARAGTRSPGAAFAPVAPRRALASTGVQPALGPARPASIAPHQSAAARGPRSALAAAAGGAQAGSAPAPRLVWFKHDLRLDDNPALSAAARPGGGPVAGIYVLDPSLVAVSAPGACGAAALAGALSALRAGLRARGTDLWVVRCQPGEGVGRAVARVAAAAGAAEVHAEEEVLAGWTDAVAEAGAALKGAGAAAALIAHRAPPLHEAEPSGAADNWKAHVKGRGRRVAPLPDLGAMPAPGAALIAALGGAPGPIPSADALAALAGAASPASSLPAGAAAAWPPAGAAAAVEYAALGIGSFGSPPPAAAAATWLAAGGEPAARAALAAYLGPSAPGHGRAGADALAAVAAGAASAEGPGTPGGSFPALFAPALALGTISRRRVASDAAATLARFPPLPALSVPAASTHARAAAAAAEAADFYWAQAVGRAGAPAGGSPAAAGVATLRHWRWRGVLVEYVEALPSSADPARFSPADDAAAPAILLIHGFGAFGEQYRDQLAGLAGAGFRVYAPSLPGYGRSEKAPLPYGQAAWAGFCRDFVQACVRAPVVAAGNSIGGYIVAALAADAPRSIAGVVMLNPAGRVDGLTAGEAAGGGAPVQPAPEGSDPAPPNRLFVEALSRALFLYLELSIGRTLKRLYPTDPARADAWLAGEIGRAAADPGALAVFQSVFYMPRPRALDALVARDYGGPALILQGALDPLNDARRRAADLLAACPNAELVLLEAGHCPHDEVPERVTEELARFATACFERAGKVEEQERAVAGVVG